MSGVRSILDAHPPTSPHAGGPLKRGLSEGGTVYCYDYTPLITEVLITHT